MRPWEKNLKKLQHFFKHHGHSDVPSNWKSDQVLAQWVENIRTSKKRLSLELRAELLKLKFNFEPAEDGNWSSMYQQLAAYWKAHGHSYVPFEGKLENLAHWARSQREGRARLSSERIKMLDELDFDWSLHSQKRNQWELMFQELKKFKDKYGHTKVLASDTEHSKLSTWVHNARARADRLDRNQKRKLDELGFLWQKDLHQLKEAKWTTRYQQLLDFKNHFGHCNVPIKWKENKQLSVWVSEQRLRQKNKGLLPERKKLLDKVGFSWSEDLVRQYDEGWNSMCERIRGFQAMHGHLRIPSTRKYRDLKNWALSQRIMHKHGYLPAEKQKKLQSAGFILANVREVEWNKRYNLLKAFKKQRGTLNVPRKNPGRYAGIGEWVTAQRQLRAKGKLASDRIKKLDAIGFDWTVVRPHEVWMEMYQRLVAFKKKYNHLQVPQSTEAFRSLAKWMGRQRQNRNRGELLKSRIKMLDAIGFDWVSQMKMAWQKNCEALVAFKKEHGHLLVPSNVAENKPLARWLGKQREEWRLGTLSKDRFKMLNDLGFEWSPKIGRRKDYVYESKTKGKFL